MDKNHLIDYNFIRGIGLARLKGSNASSVKYWWYNIH